MTTPTPPTSGLQAEHDHPPEYLCSFTCPALRTRYRPPQPVPTATPGGMEFEMVFHDWIGRGCKSVYSDKPELSYGNFHSGTCFRGLIKLDSEQKNELKEAMRNGFFPVFRILPTESEGGAG